MHKIDILGMLSLSCTQEGYREAERGRKRDRKLVKEVVKTNYNIQGFVSEV